jgi:hypothetical protein
MTVVNRDSTIRAKDSPALTEIRGIFPTDVVIETALEMGLKDLRNNPSQLEYVFASLLVDTETAGTYGQKERDNAIAWFNKSNIPVLAEIRLDNDTFPSVSYALMGDDQVEETLSDLNYQTGQDVFAEWEPLTPRFDPRYTPSTGLVVVSQSLLALTPVTTDMVLVTGQGKTHSVLGVVDNGFYIASGLTLDLRNSVLKYAKTRLHTGIGSCNFKQIIKIGCHTVGDPRFIFYLWSIVKYILLRYRPTLLEGRGFERSTISSGPVGRNMAFDVENLYSRDITLVGFVRDSWASVQTERIREVYTNPTDSSGIRFSPVGTATDETTTWSTEPNIDDPVWAAMDPIGIDRL